MNDLSLESREIGALTFICPVEAHAPAARHGHGRPPSRRWRTTVGTVGLPGLVVYGVLAYFVVLVGALGWFLLLP